MSIVPVISDLGEGAGCLPNGPNRFLARQPILDRQSRVVGYEMLFRSGWTNSFSGDGELATRQTIDNLLVTGADSLTDHTLAFVNCTRNALVSGLVTILPPASTVIEILETIEPDEEVISACRDLKTMGYRLALDDFVLRDGMTTLIEFADFIKIDFRATRFEERRTIIKSLRLIHASLLAEKIEDVAEFESAIAEGFSHFQGYFFCRPTIVARHEVPPARISALRLVTALSRSPVDISELEQAIKEEPSLCYRLLRLVNSPIYAIHNRVESVRSALLLVGEREFRKLSIVALVGSLGKHHGHALLSLSLQRARFCELIAPYIGQNPPEQYLLGLLSAVDAILELPMATIVQSLPLRPTTRLALLGERNAEACGLSVARRYETGEWDRITEEERNLKTDEFQLARMYAESVRWTDLTLHPSDHHEGKLVVGE